MGGEVGRVDGSGVSSVRVQLCREDPLEPREPLHPCPPSLPIPHKGIPQWQLDYLLPYSQHSVSAPLQVLDILIFPIPLLLNAGFSSIVALTP